MQSLVGNKKIAATWLVVSTLVTDVYGSHVTGISQKGKMELEQKLGPLQV
jgi:hypothetical protein